MADQEQISKTGDGLLVRAPAKINLSLLIAGKRADGFHEIETVMAKVDWYDEILIQKSQKLGIELVCQGPCWAPGGKDNLVYRACELLLKDYREAPNLKITLTKNITAGTGLGSGSSDAAATLIGVREFLQLAVGAEELKQMAAELGSDVAFFLEGPLAYCTGKGEKIRKIDKVFSFLALLIVPDVSVSTEKVYANYEHDSALYERLHGQINGYIEKNKIDLAAGMCANMLEAICVRLHPGLATLKRRIELFGIGPLCLSGSGSAMFCLFDSGGESAARQWQRELKAKFGCKSVLVRNNRW